MAEENKLETYDWANDIKTDVVACEIDDPSCEACGS